jgi:2-polyprenyl-3-methyl-5-hydroxy-6-metoxy-1,4-benzoquinol methylase
MQIHTSELDAFVKAVQLANDSFEHPSVKDRFLPLDLKFDTKVDQSADPFSDQYYQQQLELYREIAGRPLDQASGELHPFDVSGIMTAANPTGSGNASNTAEQVRALSALLALASVGDFPKVLDMGAGGGLSSEVYAYAGCDVHAVDIDPLLAEVAVHRAKDRKFAISRSVMNFDDAAQIEGAPYQAAFFYQ